VMAKMMRLQLGLCSTTSIQRRCRTSISMMVRPMVIFFSLRTSYSEIFLLNVTEDHTNLHRHARHNAQEAIALARQRALQFDTQAALERKTNQALQLAKAQAHVRDESEDRREGPSGSSKAPLVDRQPIFSSTIFYSFSLIVGLFSRLGRTEFPEPHFLERAVDDRATSNAHGPAERISAQRT